MLLHGSDVEKFHLYGVTHCHVSKIRGDLFNEMLALVGLRGLYVKE